MRMQVQLASGVPKVVTPTVTGGRSGGSVYLTIPKHLDKMFPSLKRTQFLIFVDYDQGELIFKSINGKL